MTTTRRSAEETARLGDEIYERDIRSLVEDVHDGAFIAINVASGDWAMGESELSAVDRLRAQQPDAIDVWLLRVGYRVVASIGGGAPRRSR